MLVDRATSANIGHGGSRSRRVWRQQYYLCLSYTFTWVVNAPLKTCPRSLKGTLAAYRIQAFSRRQLFSRVPSTTCSFRHTLSRSSSTTAPYPCCALYGNTTLIDPEYKPYNQEEPATRIDWRARASRPKLSAAPRKKQKNARRIVGERDVLAEGQPFYHEVEAYSERCVTSYLFQNTNVSS